MDPYFTLCPLEQSYPTNHTKSHPNTPLLSHIPTERNSQPHLIPPELQPMTKPPLVTRHTKIYPTLQSPIEPPTLQSPIEPPTANPPKPKTAPPQPTKPAQQPKLHITTHNEADQALLASLQDRIDSLPTSTTIHNEISKSAHIRLMQPAAQALHHPAAPILQTYASTGCLMDCGPDWSKEQIEETLHYGAHPSAKKAEARSYLITETTAKVQEGFAKIIWYGGIKHNLPPKLKLSPVAMVPHQSRTFRVILDLSFQLRSVHHPHPSVNDTTKCSRRMMT